VNDSLPPSPNVPRVLLCVALRNMLYGGLTEAIGEFSSHTGQRSKMRAFVTSRMKRRTFPGARDGWSAAAGSTAPAAARPAAARARLRTKSRRPTEPASS
jgi:hypothetical protein